MNKTVVINAVGLTPRLLGEATPRLKAFAAGARLAGIGDVIPAVTCSVQATYLTGKWPDEHGIVGNGWYFRDECEIKFWRQSNKLVRQKKVWEKAKELNPAFTCANLFWWYNMYSSADYSITPRPMYPADGRKLPDVYTRPAGLRDELQSQLGQFPLFQFWGPATSIKSTRWIAEAALHVDRKYDPTLTLIYLPHLDYALQRLGPDNPQIATDLRELDGVCGRLLDYYAAQDAKIMILSEYGIAPVNRPVHINRVLREHGLIAIREEMDRELLDAGASTAFSVADHQLAHVYVNDRTRLEEVRALLKSTPGIEQVLDEQGQQSLHLHHERSGDLIAVAEPGAWFTYYYWLDDAKSPDFARTVDIHRKPGYDPAELFIDPAIKSPKLKLARTLLKKKLGLRYLMDVIPLDASLVRGSHGRPAANPQDAPLLITQQADLVPGDKLSPTQIHDLILRHLGLTP